MTDLRHEAYATAPAAGWYPDPANVASSRWWDGSGWTDHVQPAAVAAVPEVAEVASVPEVVPEPPRSANLDADGVPLTLFADSVFPPAVLTGPTGPSSQSDWHNQTGRVSTVRRQSGGSVSLSTAAPSAAGRRNDPYDRSWMSGLAIVLAVLSIPALALSVAWDLPPLTQSIFGGAPIAIGLLALVAAVRRGRGIVLPVVAVIISGGVLLTGILVDHEILRSIVATVTGLLPS